MGYWVRSGEFVFIAVLGGTGHAIGAFLGSFIFEFVKLYAAALLTGAWQLALGVVLILIIFLAPEGLVGILARFRKQAATPKKKPQSQNLRIKTPNRFSKHPAPATEGEE